MKSARRRAVRSLAACGTAMAVLATHSPPAASASGPVTTTASAVRGGDLASGTKAYVSYQIEHQVHETVEPNTPLGGVRIDRSEHVDAFEGSWGPDSNEITTWMSPPGGTFQFDPESEFISSTYFSNRLDRASNAVPLQAGDRTELSVVDFPGNSLLTWDAPRGETGGTPGWDLATHLSTVSASYGGQEGAVEALFFRADAVVRGGDLDARAGEVSIPPLEIPLPRTYTDRTSLPYFHSRIHPYTAYLSGVRLEFSPQTGTAVLRGSLRGYVPEAKERTLPSGAEIAEWHLPVHGVILLPRDDESPLQGRARIDLPDGGVGMVGDGTRERSFALDRSSEVLFGEDVIAPLGRKRDDLQAPSGADRTASAAPSSAEEGFGSRTLDEVAAASEVDHELASPTRLSLGRGQYEVTLDPDTGGSGILSLRDVVSPHGDAPITDLMATPYVEVEGTRIPLDRSRLVDLRVQPVVPGSGIIFTGLYSGTPMNYGRQAASDLVERGFYVEAVYDLGSDRYAFLTFETSHFGEPPTPVLMRVRVRDLSTGFGVPATITQVTELASGAVAIGDTTYDHEFSAPLDLQHASVPLTAGPHSFQGTAFRSDGPATVTVKAGRASLGAPQEADPSVALGEGPLSLYYTSPAGVPTTSVFSRASVTRRAEPAPSIPELGTLCGEAQVIDGPVGEAQPELDVQRAWLDNDGTNLYATLQLANVPEAAPPGTSYRWSLHWRGEWNSRFLAAKLDPDGNWSYLFGGYNGGFFPSPSIGATGEVKTGTGGFIRVAVPLRPLGLDAGDVLRDTSAHSFAETAVATVRVDSAPDGTDATHGSGGPFTLGTGCASSILDTVLSFTATEASGQYGDDLPVGVTLRDGAGEPVEDATVNLQLGDATVSGVTGPSGDVSWDLPLTVDPGEHVISAHFSGSEGYGSSGATLPVTITAEDTRSSLTLSGRGAAKVLEARLVENDGAPLAARTFTFEGNGTEMGSALTDEEGVARFEVPPAYRGRRATFAARFAGDVHYLPSSATTD